MICSTSETFSGFFNIDESVVRGLSVCVVEFQSKVEGRAKETYELNESYLVKDDEQISYHLHSVTELESFVSEKRIFVQEIRFDLSFWDPTHRLEVVVSRNAEQKYGVS